MAFVLVARLTAKDGEQDRAAELIPSSSRRRAPSRATCTTSPTAIPRTRASSSCTSTTATRRRSRSTAQTEHFQTLGVGEIFPLMENRERNFYETFE